MTATSFETRRAYRGPVKEYSGSILNCRGETQGVRKSSGQRCLPGSGSIRSSSASLYLPAGIVACVHTPISPGRDAPRKGDRFVKEISSFRLFDLELLGFQLGRITDFRRVARDETRTEPLSMKMDDSERGKEEGGIWKWCLVSKSGKEYNKREKRDYLSRKIVIF